MIQRMLSMMSWNRRAGLLEGNKAILVDSGLHALGSNRLFDEIDGPTEQGGQLLTQRVELGKIVETAAGETLIETDRQVDIRLLATLTACG